MHSIVIKRHALTQNLRCCRGKKLSYMVKQGRKRPLDTPKRMIERKREKERERKKER